MAGKVDLHALEPDHTDRKGGPQQGQPPLDFSRYNKLNSTFPEPIAPAAFHGVSGHVVEAIAEQSEASREAILFQFLCSIGNVIGRSAYAYSGDALHHPRLWTVLVGDTSKGRKGTAWNGVKRLLDRLDKKWLTTRVTSGASTGEGIIHKVRDPKYGIPKSRKSRKNGHQEDQEETLLDAGEYDKRLLITEEEFAQIFKVIERSGNTLSPVARQAWDGTQLSIANKNSPEKATDPHVTIIGHITKEELSKFNGSSELLNGFANRFLWCGAKRAQVLPFSECVKWDEHLHLLRVLEDVLKHFNPITTPIRVARNQEANTLWLKHYETLSQGYGGVLGGILNRAEAQVFRLSMIYAVLDNQAEIRPEHLQAALAVWEYSVSSAKWIFGDSTGNWRADKILWELQRCPSGISRTTINDQVFKRNSTRTDIDQALSVLFQNRLAIPSEIREGRYRTEFWKLAS
jgi:hypothetical protein